MDPPRTTKDRAKVLRRTLSLPEVLLWLAQSGVRTLRLPARLVLDDVRNATRTIEAFLDGELLAAPPQGQLSQSD